MEHQRPIIQDLRRGALPMALCLLCWVACEDNHAQGDAGPGIDHGARDMGDAAVDDLAESDQAPLLLPRFTSGPELVPNSNPGVPLAAIVKFTTDQPVIAALEIRGGHQGRRVTFQQTDTAFSLPVLGLAPEQSYTVEVLISAMGHQVKAPEVLSGVAGSLPAGFPPLETTISQAKLMEPGVVLLKPIVLGEGVDLGIAFAVNQAGEVIWYYQPEGSFKSMIRPLASGNLMILGRGNIFEIDMLGHTVQRWHAAETAEEPAPEPAPGSTPIQAPLFHHDIIELPSGNLLLLSRESRSIENYPTSTSDPLAPTASAQVAGDLILEIQRDGTIVGSWSLLDLLDPLRISYSSLNSNRWPALWPGGTLRDWSHANGLAYNKDDDAILVSIRHQDAVIKFSRQSGELAWILGPHDNWTAPWSQVLLTPQGGMEWPYHAHAPQITPQGTIMLFDNGNNRASPYDPPLPITDSYSRAVELAVDAQSMTVSQLWSYGGPGDEIFYSASMSSAYQLPQTGNVLVTDGNRVTDPAGNPSHGEDAMFWARVVEVTRTQPAEKVFELVIRDEAAVGALKWRVYRSYKLPSLYPSQLARVEPIP